MRKFVQRVLADQHASARVEPFDHERIGYRDVVAVCTRMSGREDARCLIVVLHTEGNAVQATAITAVRDLFSCAAGLFSRVLGGDADVRVERGVDAFDACENGFGQLDRRERAGLDLARCLGNRLRDIGRKWDALFTHAASVATARAGRPRFHLG